MGQVHVASDGSANPAAPWPSVLLLSPAAHPPAQAATCAEGSVRHRCPLWSLALWLSAHYEARAAFLQSA